MPEMSDAPNHPNERVNVLATLIRDIITGPTGNFQLAYPNEVDVDKSVLHKDDVIDRIGHTVWPVTLDDGRAVQLSFVELLVLIEQIERIKEVKAEALRTGTNRVNFDLDIRVDPQNKIMPPQNSKACVSNLVVAGQ
jgi:hypothetical protein